MEPNLLDLPTGVLRHVLEKMPGKNLARVSTTCRLLRAFVAEPVLWQHACRMQWPHSRTNLHQVYGDNWKEAFCSRSVLPPTFINLLDRLHQYHLDEELMLGATPDGERFEQMMHCVFSLGLTCAAPQHRGLTACPEYYSMQEELRCFISLTQLDHVKLLLQFVASTRALLDEYDFWGGGFVRWPDVPWRRSGLQFLVDMFYTEFHDESRPHDDPLILSIQELDAAIKSVAEEAVSLSMAPPAGTPRSHFWYYLDPSFVQRSC